MNAIIAVAGAVIFFVVAAVVSAASDLIEEEAKGWLEAIPAIVLRTAAMYLSADQRVTVYRDEWLPELLFIARKTDRRPITRFLTCTRYSPGLLRSSRRVARHLRTAQRRELADIKANPQPHASGHDDQDPSHVISTVGLHWAPED